MSLESRKPPPLMPPVSGTVSPGPQAREGDALAEVKALLTPPLVPGDLGRLGPYRVLRILGGGGMGVVFEAEDPQLRRRVALKIPRPALLARPGVSRRFLLEARAAAALEHEHAVPIYHVGEDRGIPFLAMQMLQGETLEARIDREGKLPLVEVLRVGRQLADVLAAAHRQGLIHRDIKPSNVWLEAGSGRAKLLDFGLVRMADENQEDLTPSGIVLGTPAYMAPEQARGESIDARCDLFSLGCVLYQMCAGCAPFKQASPYQSLDRRLPEQPVPLGQRNPNVPPALERIVQKLLAPALDERFATTAAVCDALAAITTGERHARRPRGSWLVVAGVAALLLAGLAAVFFSRSSPEPTPRIEAKPFGPLPAVFKHEGEAWAIAFHPNGQHVLTGGHDCVIRVWDLKTEKQLHVLDQHEGPIVDLAFSPDGKTLASASWDKTIQLWDTAHWKPKARLAGHLDEIWALAFAPSGQHLYSCGHDKRVLSWNLEISGRPDSEPAVLDGITPLGHLHSLVVSPDGKTLAIADGKGPIYLWDIPSAQVRTTLHGHQEDVRSLRFTADNKRLVSGGFDRTIKVWDLSTETVLRTLSGPTRAIWYMALSPDERTVAAGCWGGQLWLWDLATGECLHQLESHKGGTWRVAFHRDGTPLASAGRDGAIRFWDVSGRIGKPSPQTWRAGSH